jgi:hypothetical protein
MYPIDLVKYTNTKRKIPTAILSASADHLQTSHQGVFKSYFQDGVAVLWGASILGQIFVMQFSSFIIGPMQVKFLSKLPQFAMTSMMYAPLLGCLYYAFSYHLNHGQTFGLFRNKKKISFTQMNWKNITRYSVYSSFVGSLFGLPLLSKKFITWSEKTLGFQFKPHDDLYRDLFVPKNEWAPVLLDRTLPELPVSETQDEEFSYSQAA